MQPLDPTTIRYAVAQGVATITLNRPEVKNALGRAEWHALGAAVARAADDPAVRAVIVTGAGGTFCAGGDLKTMPERLAIAGGSNGGLLVAACMLQRPELFGAVHCAVPVIDMLRYHRFTVGRYWVGEYGNAEASAEQFRFMLEYSPLHNVRPGTAYPATMVMTGDHDDRVLPGHSYKFAATLQAAQGGTAPILLRVETSAGHGAGKPTGKLIDEAADRWAFLAAVLGA